MTTTPDVPAERERDELPSLNDLRDWAGRWLDEHRAEAAHARRYAALLRSPEAPDDPFGTAEESEADAESADAEAAMYAAVLALLAQREAPICLECIERAEQEIAAGHYYRADELMAALRERREPVCACGETHPDRTPLAGPAPETREPTQAEIDDACMWYRHDFGLMSDEDAGRLRFTAREWLRAWHKAGARELLGAPAPGDDPASGEPSGADAAVREALDAIKKAHAAVDDLCNGRRWTMSIPARPDADHDLVIDDALTKAERVIRSLTDVPAAPGAPEEGAGE